MTLDLSLFPVLVVDDEQDNLDAFRFNFKKAFRITTAQSGAEALEVSIAAELIQLRWGGTGQALTDTEGRIHHQFAG